MTTLEAIEGQIIPEGLGPVTAERLEKRVQHDQS